MDPRAILAKTRKNIDDVEKNIQTLVNSLKAEQFVDEIKPSRQSSEGRAKDSDGTIEKSIRRTSSFDDMIIEHASFCVPCFEDCVFGVTLENNTATTLSAPEVVVSVLQSEGEDVLFRSFSYKYRVMHVDEPGAVPNRIPTVHTNEDIKDVLPKEKFKVLVSCTNPQLLKKSTASPVLVVNLLISGKSIWKRSINPEDGDTRGGQLSHLKDIAQVRSSFTKEMVITANRKVQLGPLTREFLKGKLKLEEVSRVHATFDVDICFYLTQEHGLHWGCLVRSVASAREPNRIMLSFYTRTSDQMRLLNIEFQKWLNEQAGLQSCPLAHKDYKMTESLSETVNEELKLLMQLIFMQQNNIIPSEASSSTRILQTKVMVSNWLKSYVAAAERSDTAFLTRNNE